MKYFSTTIRFLTVISLCGAVSYAHAGRCRSVLKSFIERWKKDPVPSRAYIHEELMERWKRHPKEQKIVIQRNQIFFIDNNRLFSKTQQSGKVDYHSVFGLQVQTVVSYNQSLAVLQEGGLVSVFDKQTNRWVEIGDSAKKILSTGAHLFALINDELWRYTGRPDSVFMPSPFSINLQGGFSFKKTGVEGIQNIELSEDGLSVVLIPYNRPPYLLDSFDSNTKHDYSL